MLSTAIKYFLEVANAGSLTVAAQRLYVAPSAVSRMIRKLEEQYEIALFERHGRGMVLTEGGQLLATSARRGQLEAERAKFDIFDLRKVGKRLIRISANQAFGMELVPLLICRFQNIDSAVAFNLDLLQAKEIYRRVREGEDDIGLYYSLTPAKGVHLQYSKRMHILALMQADHPLAGKSSVTLRDIAQYPVGQMSSGTTIRAIVDLCCMQENLDLSQAFVSNNVTALQNFCANRDGAIIFLGELTSTAITKQGGLVALPISNPSLHQRHLQIITMEGREMPNNTKRFLDLAIDYIERSIDFV